MNKFINYIGSGKRELLPVAAYYLVLLFIAMSWTEKAMIEPRTIFRLLFTVLFVLPLFKYRRIAPAVLAVFMTTRLFSVSPYGYLPSDPIYPFYLTLILFIVEIAARNFTGSKFFPFSGLSKGSIALVIFCLLSNLVNLNTNYSFLILMCSALMLTRFIKSSEEIQMLEIAFMVITFCLSVYAFIFSDEFAVKDQIRRAVVERSYWKDPNYLGCILSIGIITSFYYYMNRVKDKLIFRISYLSVFIMGYIVLGILASRGAFLAAIVPTLYILYKKTNSIKNLVYVVLFISITIAVFSSTNYFSGLFLRFNSGDTTGSDRTNIWETSFNAFLNSDMPTLLVGGGTSYCNVLVGKSFGQISYSPHNNYLAILYDYGILGFIIFLFMFYSWYKKNAHNVLAVSLILFFGLVCMTLVPLADYLYCYLLALFERYASGSNSRTVQRKNINYLGQNQWRMRRLSVPVKSVSRTVR